MSATTERSAISHYDRKSRAVRWAFGLISGATFLALLVAGLGPLLWAAKASVSTTQDLLRHPLTPWPTEGFQWQNLGRAWFELGVGRFLGNTAIIATGTVVTTLVTTVTIAYVLSVLRPAWGPAVSAAILTTLFIPGIIVLVPLYLTVQDLPVTGGSLQNTYLAIWLPAAANAFYVLVMKRFFDTLPRELFDAARVDGAGAWRVLVLIVLPLSRPIIGVVALLAAIASWKDFLWPLLVLSDPELQPIQVALSRLGAGSRLTEQMAAVFLSLLPPLVLFLVFQRQFLRGVSFAGGIKQ